MILRYNKNNSLTLLILIVGIEQFKTLANTMDNNRIRMEMTNTGSDKMEQTPAIIHFSQQSGDNDNNADKNQENVSIIQSDSYAKSVHQVHDFVMQHKKGANQVSSLSDSHSSSNNDDNSLLVSDIIKREQQVSSEEPENNESDAFDGLNGMPPQLSYLPLAVTRGRTSKLFKR